MSNKKRRKGAPVPREIGARIPRAAPANRAGKLSGKIALITGGESKLGRAVAELFALEGAEISISCSTEHEQAAETKGGCTGRIRGRRSLDWERRSGAVVTVISSQ